MNAITIDRFTTLDRPRAERLDAWNGFIGGLFHGMVIEADPDLSASWLQCRAGDIGLASARSQRARINRCERDVLASSDRLLIHLQHRGSSVNGQYGRSAVLGPGDMTFVVADRPYHITLSDRNYMFVVDCPIDRLGLSRPEIDQRAALGLSGSTPTVSLLRDFVGSVLRQAWNHQHPAECEEAIGDMILRLAGLCLQATGTAAAPAPGKATRRRVIDFIDQRLHEPDLRTSTIARALSLSPRTVQDVMAEMATTPTAYIQRRRLAVAAECLRAGQDFGSVTDLAFDLGFNDSAYFARCFKSRYGMTPTAYRSRPGA
ncbi:helix-turn-helix domain-containing protein [Phenylobacterium montanum]|uniref:Helix-turn-helix domain-containing protein n=1 Tax=Phenylobacterium montanum TaxID=2823693 RepID=A0A975G344_9CAUL|nr:helix-turn-helix domain-containing protein [Caulobacter sp. S6]QUD89664.1 helix-turn-helix domain-containing protein [Caulobacter sp. S6]